MMAHTHICVICGNDTLISFGVGVNIFKALCRVSACTGISMLTKYLSTRWREHHRTVVDDVVWKIYKLVRFWRL